ncbi:predicted protein [Nematostella vectensis]|uniref:Reticulocalbin-3 n=1 Tax=Nematostella vectensis TaxID=45351 RepID=A7SYN5_NEMVE|nr:predicted protein [Nematostella vectensis]|eukprot:XP_001623285.1 predicted protein [Nematostella vectensis]
MRILGTKLALFSILLIAPIFIFVKGGYGSLEGGCSGASDSGSCGSAPQDGGGPSADAGSCGGDAPPSGGPSEGMCGAPPKDEGGSCGGGSSSPGQGMCGAGGGGDGSSASNMPQVSRSMESKIKLRRILRKIDTNKDRKITEQELKDHIKTMIDARLAEEGKKLMELYDNNMDGGVTWDEYANRSGYNSGDLSEPTGDQEKAKLNEKRRFAAADTDKDEKLTAVEIAMMMMPEDSPNMADVVIAEYLDNFDKDNDGKISKKEFIGAGSEDEKLDKEVEEGLATQFDDDDRDSSGFLEKDEIAGMLMPDDASLLFRNTDTDMDGFLTEKEIYKNYMQFASSRITDFGELIKEDKKVTQEDQEPEKKSNESDPQKDQETDNKTSKKESQEELREADETPKKKDEL